MKTQTKNSIIYFLILLVLFMSGVVQYVGEYLRGNFGESYLFAFICFLLLFLLSISINPIIKNLFIPARDMVLALLVKLKEADLEKKKKTIEELKKLQGYISDARLAIDRGFISNKSRHGGGLLLKKYEWLTGKVDLEKGVTLRVIDDRIDKIIAIMEIYPYQEALNKLEAKEPRKGCILGRE